MSLSTRLITLSDNLKHFVNDDQNNELLLNETFNTNKDKIIDILGGISNIIELCMTNPNASKQLDSKKIESFEKLMNDNGIILTDEVKIIDEMKRVTKPINSHDHNDFNKNNSVNVSPIPSNKTSKNDSFKKSNKIEKCTI